MSGGGDRTVTVTVRYFGPAADAAGAGAEEIDLERPATLASLREQLFSRHPSLAEQEGVLRYAVNREYVDGDLSLSSGDEVAVLPPVAGGTSRAFVELTREPIDLSRLIQKVESHSAGAICSFQGTVRAEREENRLAGLEYSAYEEMAAEKLRQMCGGAMQRFEIAAVAVVHRLGRMGLGETSVAIVVSAPHRKDSFRACRYLIDTLKAEVPVWKKELWRDGEASWVDPTKES